MTLPALARANAIPVNTLADPGLASQCSLRSAILASVKTRVIDGCPASSGADTVVFGSLTGTITLANALSVTGNNGVLTITGPAGGITISGNDQVRTINPSAGILNLQNFTLTRGKASLGAAIFNGGGIVTVSDCVFSNNTAVQIGNGGAGLFNQNGAVTAVNSSFLDNIMPILHGFAAASAIRGLLYLCKVLNPPVLLH